MPLGWDRGGGAMEPQLDPGLDGWEVSGLAGRSLEWWGGGKGGGTVLEVGLRSLVSLVINNCYPSHQKFMIESLATNELKERKLRVSRAIIVSRIA